MKLIQIRNLMPLPLTDLKIMKPKIGFMQGRLSSKVNGKIQAFPWESWKEEFEIALVAVLVLWNGH